MENQFDRSALVLGKEAMDRLGSKSVAVFGIGGVGGYVAEALARCGIGRLVLVDGDVVSLTNLNRQILALHSTIGRPKVKVMAERVRDICPSIETEAVYGYYPESARVDFSSVDYIVDAVDDIKAKVLLALEAQKNKTPILSAMGAGNKLDPMGFKVADIYKTKVCPLAKLMRREYRAAGIEHLKCVYSEEMPAERPEGTDERTVGSVSFVPPAAGLLMASEVIRDLLDL